ncbi:LysR family transcriptional regulator [Microbacterium sp. RD1]|uniref:LysR family transcriptional regulator n=1 Tax=Microbacterium sp. RD1 TaxID=3457313 RepID=UPI003FA57BF7
MADDNRISLQKLEVFCRVAELGGVRRAAEELYISQPVVSAHIRSLQERVGAKLFQRDGRGIVLTEAGERVLLWATDVLRGRTELDKELASLSNGSAGSASVGCTITVGNTVLAPTIIAYKVQHPGARIRLEMSPAEAALEGVRTGRLDFAVVAGDGVFDSRTFRAELLARPRLVVIASAANSDVPDRIDVGALAALPFVAPPEGLAIRRSQDAALAAIGVHDRRVEIELGSADAIKSAVIENLGVALLSRNGVADEIAAGVLREIEVVDAPAMHDMVFMVHRTAQRFSALQRNLRTVVREAMIERYGAPATAD